jgi:hypothetical protein
MQLAMKQKVTAQLKPSLPSRALWLTRTPMSTIPPQQARRLETLSTGVNRGCRSAAVAGLSMAAGSGHFESGLDKKTTSTQQGEINE